jgi:hypothetical protein
MTKRKTKKQEGLRMLAAYVPPETYGHFQRIAERNERTVAGEIRQMVRDAIEREREAA